jgi:plasmid stability protein
MAQILIRDLSAETVEQLKELARHNRRSLEAEVRGILEDVARRERRLTVEELLKIADNIREASGPQSTDSTDLIREDRER